MSRAGGGQGGAPSRVGMQAGVHRALVLCQVGRGEGVGRGGGGGKVEEVEEKEAEEKEVEEKEEGDSCR